VVAKGKKNVGGGGKAKDKESQGEGGSVNAAKQAVEEFEAKVGLYQLESSLPIY
jgi:hypothetical protein